MIERINSERALRGLPALRPNEQLAAAAQGHAEDLATYPELIAQGQYHTGSDGSTIEGRIKATGYEPLQYSELTGWGFEGNPEAMVNWWINSQAHALYLFADNVNEIGIGYTYLPGSTWEHYWTVNFGRRDGPPDEADFVTYVPVVVGGGG